MIIIFLQCPQPQESVARLNESVPDDEQPLVVLQIDTDTGEMIAVGANLHFSSVQKE